MQRRKIALAALRITVRKPHPPLNRKLKMKFLPLATPRTREKKATSQVKFKPTSAACTIRIGSKTNKPKHSIKGLSTGRDSIVLLAQLSPEFDNGSHFSHLSAFEVQSEPSASFGRVFLCTWRQAASTSDKI